MADSRAPIPRELKRRVLVEAGHRCAIPTCRATTTELAHITPWAECKVHEFSNLIALCPNCHTRFDRGEIDRKSMTIYKANLGLLNGRYSDFERRMLEDLVQSGANSLRLPVGHRLFLSYLIKDGLLKEPILDRNAAHALFGDVPMLGFEEYEVTPTGRDFLQSYASATSLADGDEE